MTKDEESQGPNIDLEKVDIAIVNRYLRRAGLKKKGNLSERVLSLQQHYLDLLEKTEELQPAECDNCGAHSPLNLPECPFCGDSETQAEAPGTAMNVWEPKAIEGGVQYSLADLDAAVNEIRRNVKLAATQVHKVGQTLKWIQDGKLWALRKAENGLKMYRGFYDFCKTELNISNEYAQRLVKISTEYSPEQIRDYGMTRLALSLKLPKESREDFLQVAKKTPTTDGKKLGQLAKRKQQEANGGEIIDAPKVIISTKVELGIKRSPLWKRPYADHPVGRPTRPATTLADEPWFHVKFEDVSVIVKLVKTITGDIEAQIETHKALNV